MNEEIKKFIDPIRKAKLKDSDFTQLADSPLTQAQKDAWATYRQELRDMPENQNPASVETVMWPSKPE